MDFKDLIKQLSERVDRLKDNLQTEEATKNALIMPFLQALGYDVFNPLEIVPEYTCDIGTKKGEKIDYAVLKDGETCMLIECKHWNQSLNLHDNQLLRYFHVSKAKFGILTNGIQYRFYTDLVEKNKMDEKPFLDILITDIKDSQIDELKKFHKSYFDVDNIVSTANELKYTSELKAIISSEFANPSEQFVKMLARPVYQGVITAKILEQFTGLVKKSLQGYVNDQITDRLKSALTKETDVQEKAESTLVTEVVDEQKVVTTQEEIEGWITIKAILRESVDPARVTYRDAQTYCAILLDDNNRKAICRLYLNGKKKFVAFLDANKKEQKEEITGIDNLYNFKDKFVQVINLLEPK
jgi:hypothetical protein